MPVPHGSVPERILDYATDIWLALKGIVQELERWNTRPVSGRIYINGVESMTTSNTVEIPAEDVPAKVDWADRLGGAIAHDKTATTWSAEDQNGAPSTAVTVDPDTDADSDDETATVTFKASTGTFRVVATTPGANGQVRAESGFYTITPGAPAVGMISVQSK